MAEKKKKVLLIGEQPDIELIAMLREDGYEVVTLESAHRARGVFPLYKPHVILVFPRYPQELAILEECMAIAGTVPVVAAISRIANAKLVKAVKEKAAAFIVLPGKPQTIRGILQGVALFEDKAQCSSDGKMILGTESESPGEKRPHIAGTL